MENYVKINKITSYYKDKIETILKRNLIIPHDYQYLMDYVSNFEIDKKKDSIIERNLIKNNDKLLLHQYYDYLDTIKYMTYKLLFDKQKNKDKQIEKEYIPLPPVAHPNLPTIQPIDERCNPENDEIAIGEILGFESDSGLWFGSGFGSEFGSGFGSGFGSEIGHAPTESINNNRMKKKYMDFRILQDLPLKTSSRNSKNVGGLKGIDKIFIINLLGSNERKQNMLYQLNNIDNTLQEGTDYVWINPINLLLDNVSISYLQKKDILPKETNYISKEIYDGEWKKGTISLSIIYYYIYTKIIKENITILLLEDDIILDDNFKQKYNEFYDALPNDEWEILELQTFHNKTKTTNIEECNMYYNNKKKNVPGLEHIILNNGRAIVNDKVIICCNENNSKAIVYKPIAPLFIPLLPILYPSSDIKNNITGFWNTGLGFSPQENLIHMNQLIVSERAKIDRGIIFGQKLPDAYKNDIIESVSEFNSLIHYYIAMAIQKYNKHIYKQINFHHCLPYNIKLNYKNITNQLCCEKNVMATNLGKHIKKYFPNFDIKKYYKFNPSLVKLNDNRYLMSYRIFMGQLGCNKFDYENCHPWINFWSSSIFKDGKQICKINYLGLCTLDINYNVLDDILLCTNDYPNGIEDVRMFIHKNIVYATGAATTGKIIKKEASYQDNRILSQMIIPLGTPESLAQALPNNKVNIYFNCIPLHKDNIEKNWFGYTNDHGKNILINPTYGNFFPLVQYNLDLENIIKSSDDDFYKKHFQDYMNTDNIKCNKIEEITMYNVVDDLNNAYKQFKNNDKGNIFRLSGGSWGVDYDANRKIFIGHMVVYTKKLDIDKVLKYIASNPTSQIANNLYSFIYLRKYQLNDSDYFMRYFMVFMIINTSNNTLERISHCFNIFENKNVDTCVNFPMGLVRNNDSFVISFGESDSSVVIAELPMYEVRKLFENVDAENYKFLSFEQDGKQICYTSDTISGGSNNYFHKYKKYKTKYLSSKKIL